MSSNTIGLSDCKEKIKDLLIDFEEIENSEYLSCQLKSIIRQIEGIESIN